MRQRILVLRVNRRLFIRAFRKYVIFFLFLCIIFFSGYGVKLVSAASSIPVNHHEQALFVTATVPLTQEFAYLIRKNSSIFLENNAFILGKEGEIVVHIQGKGNEFLKEHVVQVSIINIHKEQVVFLSGKTDISGSVSFVVTFDTRFLGKNVIHAVDITYGETLSIMHEFSFIVYEGQDDKQKAIKVVTKILIGSEMPEIIVSVAPKVAEKMYVDHKNAIIRTRPLVGALLRAGPTKNSIE